MAYVCHMHENEPLNVRSAAARLGLSTRKVTRLIEAGHLDAFKAFDGLRAPWLIRAEEIERYASLKSAA